MVLHILFALHTAAYLPITTTHVRSSVLNDAHDICPYSCHCNTSVVELRGAIPHGVINDFDPVRIVLLAIIGNILPVPFLILVIRKLFAWTNKKIPSMSRLVSLLEQRASGKSELVIKHGFWGICLLVAIPLPGTGAWTGSLRDALASEARHLDCNIQPRRQMHAHAPPRVRVR